MPILQPSLPPPTTMHTLYLVSIWHNLFTIHTSSVLFLPDIWQEDTGWSGRLCCISARSERCHAACMQVRLWFFKFWLLCLNTRIGVAKFILWSLLYLVKLSFQLTYQLSLLLLWKNTLKLMVVDVTCRIILKKNKNKQKTNNKQTKTKANKKPQDNKNKL